MGEAVTLDSLGYAEHHLGRHEQAIAHYVLALKRFREFEDQYQEAGTLGRLGDRTPRPGTGARHGRRGGRR